MKPSEIPTDNLYKFMAVFGLLLFFSSYYFLWLKFSQYSPAIYNLQAQVGIAELDQKFFLEDVATLESEVAHLKGKVESEGAKTENREYLENAAELDVKFNRLIETKRKNDKNVIILRNDLDRVKRLTKEMYFITTAFIVVSSLGGFISLKGFQLWYERLQKPLDKKLNKY